jgi:hypothetical protein
MGFVVASVFVLTATGCSDDDDDDNGGQAGSGGSSSGSGGKAGMNAGGKAGSPTGGKAGSTNEAGSGNEAGSPDPGAAGETSVGGAGGETGGGDAGEGLGGTGEGGAGGAPVVLDCEQYCEWMDASCTAANAQYPDEAQCLQSCAAFPTTAGDNSLACRIGFAALASTDAANCDAAGPAGIGECGTPCEAYCNLMLAYCPHEADGASLNACMTECGTVPENNITTFSYPAPGGDTLACRIAHATNAAKDTDPNGANRLLHCNHAAGDAAPCLDATP